jgi:phosphatidyl-myo-inositol alpha-mannosyltransferase
VGDGPLRRRYWKLAAGDPDIVFVGAVLGDRPGYYANADIYACPTTRASFGITLLEAMACATPVVCSDIDGFRDLVTNGSEAIMARAGDARDLADALVRLLDDDVLRARMGAAGRELAERYAWPMIVDRVFDVYEKALGAHSAVA